jgi:hypothetical protein
MNMFIVAAVIVVGIICVVCRSFFSLVCFGYPLSFGLLSAVIGIAEVSGYGRTLEFAASIYIGAVTSHFS